MDRKKKKVATQASTQDGDAPLGVPCLRFTTIKELQAWIEYELSKVIFYQLRSSLSKCNTGIPRFTLLMCGHKIKTAEAKPT